MKSSALFFLLSSIAIAMGASARILPAGDTIAHHLLAHTPGTNIHPPAQRMYSFQHPAHLTASIKFGAEIAVFTAPGPVSSPKQFPPIAAPVAVMLLVSAVAAAVFILLKICTREQIVASVRPVIEPRPIEEAGHQQHIELTCCRCNSLAAVFAA